MSALTIYALRHSSITQSLFNHQIITCIRYYAGNWVDAKKKIMPYSLFSNISF